MRVLKFLFVMVLMALPFASMGLPGLALPQIVPGQVEGLQPGTTAWIVQQARAGAPGFEVWTNGSLYTFMGPVGNGIGWATLQNSSAGLIAESMLANGGNLGSARTINELIECLKANGWTKIPIKEIGTALWSGPFLAAVYMVNLIRRLKAGIGRRV